MDEQNRLEQAIAAQETLRGLVDDSVIEATVGALRQQLDRLEDQPEEKRRKQVTVLFADVSGFTAMSEQMDAEDLSDALDAVWEHLDAAITSHGGLVDKHIGDAVMGLWSVDVASEDDPEQAVRAALEMQTIVGGFAESESDLSGLQLRIGINTGPVVLGEVGSTAEFTAIGDTVNVAARLESAAPIGGILVGSDTYRHVKGLFKVFEQDSLKVKGKRQPLRTFVVDGIRPRAFRLGTRGVEGIDTRMIGRDAELEQLKLLVRLAAKERSPHLALVVGEAGIGKSRLLYELEDWLHVQPDEKRLFKGRADRQHQQVPYSLLRSVFFFRFLIADNDPNDVALGKLETGITAIMGDSAAEAHLIGHLIGLDLTDSEHVGGILDDPRQLRDRAFRTIGKLFSAVAADRPVMMLLEDIHWADQGSLELLEHLLADWQGGALTIVAVARPGLFDRFPEWGHGLEVLHRIDLQPLSPTDSARLVEEVLQKVPAIPPAMITRITSSAEGNPYYVEELVKMLIEDGVIAISDDVWYADPTRLTDLTVPPTLTGVLQARLDLLASSERDLLGRASIVGRIFWDQAIPKAGDPDPVPDIDTAEVLSSLNGKELVYRDANTDFAGTEEYFFKHAILHEVTYERVLRRLRRLYHRRVADWMAGRDEAASRPALIASHYSLADAPVEAARWHTEAAVHAQARYANEDAARHYRMALEHGSLTPQERLPLYDGLRDVLMLLARYDEALESNSSMLEAAKEAGDVGGQARALMRRAAAHLRQGHSHEAVMVGEEAEQTARSQQPRDERVFCEVLTQIGWGLLRVGDLVAALAKAQEALIAAETAADPRAMRHIQALLGAIHTARGALGPAEVHFEHALDLNEQLGDRIAEGRALINLGELARIAGDFRRAEDVYGRALAIQRDLGDVDQEPLTLSNLGGALVGRHAYDQALETLESAAAAFDASGGSEHISETFRFMAEASLGLGRMTQALDQARFANVQATKDANPDHLGHSWRVLGLVSQRLGRPIAVDGSATPRSATECFAKATSIFGDSGMEIDRAMTLHDWATYELADGDRSHGEAMWSEARRKLDELGLKLAVARMDDEVQSP